MDAFILAHVWVLLQTPVVFAQQHMSLLICNLKLFHVLNFLRDPSIRNQREARNACRSPYTESYEYAKTFCEGGSRRCGAPDSASSIVILNRKLTDAEKKSIVDVYVPATTNST